MFIGTGKLMMPAENVAAQHNLKVVPLEKPDGRMHLLKGDAPGRRYDGNFIAFGKIGWADHAPKV
jgi:hypothetical protein